MQQSSGIDRPNTACTGRWGLPPAGTACGTYGKHFSGFEFFLLSNRVHACPSAMLRERELLWARRIEQPRK